MLELSLLFSGNGPMQMAKAIFVVFYIASVSIGLEQDRQHPGPKSRKEFLGINIVIGITMAVYMASQLARTINLL